ncbi:MAG: peptidase S10, partial [Candidatus Eremiobacteraeota bacterium]|nr:peptidase S10 [Candidatus Eremiobacteraeota bacterium]
MNRALSVMLLAALLGSSVAARGAEPLAKSTPVPMVVEQAPDPGALPDAVTAHTLTLDGRPMPYTARAGTITLYDQDEHPTARVFYTAFNADGSNALTRPVTFIYNGGPGSSTMWLRMGSFGPGRVLAANGEASGPPPYRIVENQYSLLDKSDLVFIDMPDSGFGRILNGKEKDFFGVDQDVAAFGQFITRYIS